MNVGKAEVELLRTAQEGSSDRNSLARFMIGGLWVSYRMTYGGESLAAELFAYGTYSVRVEATFCVIGLTCKQLKCFL